MGTMPYFRTTKYRSYIYNKYTNRSLVLSKAQRLNKESGFVEEDNSGRSNIFSTGEKALYTYSPTSDKVVQEGLGGSQGLILLVLVATLVGITTVSISNQEVPSIASSIDLSNLRSLSEISGAFLSSD